MRQLFLSERQVRVRLAEKVREVSSAMMMMMMMMIRRRRQRRRRIVKITRVVVIPLAGGVKETKNRADEEQSALLSPRHDRLFSEIQWRALSLF
jgi:CRISPR/Cas system-associated endonuclease Cas3-HD